MKKTYIFILAVIISFLAGYIFNSVISFSKEKTAMKKVTGVGGIFFKCKDPKKVKEWYADNLGFKTDDYGAGFEWRESDDTSKKGFLQWSPFSEKTKYFEPSEKEFMINYRVDDLTSLVEQLKTDGVTILDTIETYDYGKFVHILDIEGNKIELWEPNYEYEAKKSEETK